jgi:hypothetical protein
MPEREDPSFEMANPPMPAARPQQTNPAMSAFHP